MYQRFGKLFWSERIWLPPGNAWADVSNEPGTPYGAGKYPEFDDMFRAMKWGLVLMIVRAVFEWLVARPLGRHFGVEDSTVAPSLWGRIKGLMSQLGLEPGGSGRAKGGKCQQLSHRGSSVNVNLASSNGNMSTSSNGAVQPQQLHSADSGVVKRNGNLDGEAKKFAQVDSISEPPQPNLVSTNNDNNKKRRIRKIPSHSKLDKFAESGWRFTAYSILWIYGISTMLKKPWFWNTTECWIGYPHQALDGDVWWYYMFEASFYWSLMYSQFFDGQYRRSDFTMNLIHHLATISLIWFSWATNFVRFGTLILVVHDVVDPLIEGFKMIRYCTKEYPKTGNLMGNTVFLTFLVLWFATRLGILPFKLIYSSLFIADKHIEWFPVYWIFNGFLLILQVLHIIWTYMILRMLIRTLTQGETEDVRSDDDDSDVEYEKDE